jgi:hypothetical protein
MRGLTEEEALKRLSIYGKNILPSGTELLGFTHEVQRC